MSIKETLQAYSYFDLSELLNKINKDLITFEFFKTQQRYLYGLKNMVMQEINRRALFIDTLKLMNDLNYYYDPII